MDGPSRRSELLHKMVIHGYKLTLCSTSLIYGKVGCELHQLMPSTLTSYFLFGIILWLGQRVLKNFIGSD